ncbi:MAG: hypothetical protein AB1742_10610 [bacterium]
MKVIVDGVEKDWRFDEPLNLKDAILKVSERILVDGRRIVTELKLGETEEGTDMKLTPEQVPVSRVKSIYLTTEPLNDHILREFGASEARLRGAVERFSAIQEHLAAGETDVAMEKLKDAVDTLIAFFNLLSQSFFAELLDPHTLKIDDRDVQSFIASFNEKLQALVAAMENKDQVLINDYLEYELSPDVNALIAFLPRIEGIVRGT